MPSDMHTDAQCFSGSAPVRLRLLTSIVVCFHCPDCHFSSAKSARSAGAWQRPDAPVSPGYCWPLCRAGLAARNGAMCCQLNAQAHAADTAVLSSEWRLWCCATTSNCICGFNRGCPGGSLVTCPPGDLSIEAALQLG